MLLTLGFEHLLHTNKLSLITTQRSKKSTVKVPILQMAKLMSNITQSISVMAREKSDILRHNG